MNVSIPHFRKLLSVVLVTVALSNHSRAQLPPNTNAPSVLDLSPGADVYAPRLFALNRTTHKLYVAGDPSTSEINAGLKVIDTPALAVTAGIDLGRYTGNANSFYTEGIAVDESAAPLGNKVYLIGKPGTTNDYLRVIDGVTDMNLTSENTDLFLPISSGDEALTSAAMNSTNHKLYLAKANGDIVVVDGPNRQVLTTLTPNGGSFVLANPSANKIFVIGHNGGGVIDSSNDTFTPLLFTFTAVDAVLNSSANKIYVVGADQSANPGLFVIDATTGQLLSSKTGFASTPLSVTFVPDENNVYVGGASYISLFNADDLTLKNTLAQRAVHLTYDPAIIGKIFLLHDPTADRDNLKNMVGILDRTLIANPETHSAIRSVSVRALRTEIAVGYRPYALASNNLTHRIYVTDEQTPELLAIDADQHTVVSRTQVSPGLGETISHRSVSVSERLNRVYFPQTSTANTDPPNASFIGVYDGATANFLDSIAIDPTYNIPVDKIAVDDTRRRLYVPAIRNHNIGNSDLVLLVYDEDTDALITTIPLASGFVGYTDIAVNPVTGRVYLSGGFTNGAGLLVIDGDNDSTVDTLTPSGLIAINRKTNTIYISDNPPSFSNQNQIHIIDGVTDHITTNVPTNPTSAIAIDETANVLYAAVSTGNLPTTASVIAYDGNNNYQLLGQIDGGQSPVGLGFNTATRELYVANDYDGTLSVAQSTALKPPNLLGNISTRAQIGTGDDALIGGFIVTGPQNSTKRVIVRAIGPSLAQAGLAGALADPTIELHDSLGNVITNDNWKINDQTGLSQQAEIEATGVAPGNVLESALIADLPPGSCTAIVRGAGGQTGVGLVEAYDLDQSSATELANISTRGPVQPGDNVLIGGLIVLGSEPCRVVLRGIGPSLAQSGVANPLADPVLELHDPNGALIASNDNWKDGVEQEITDTGLAPTDDHESAIVATLFPANYTAIVSGKNGTTGVALVEAYNLH